MKDVWNMVACRYTAHNLKKIAGFLKMSSISENITGLKFFSKCGALQCRGNERPHYQCPFTGTFYFDPGNEIYTKAFRLLWPQALDWISDREKLGDILEAFLGAKYLYTHVFTKPWDSEGWKDALMQRLETVIYVLYRREHPQRQGTHVVFPPNAIVVRENSSLHIQEELRESFLEIFMSAMTASNSGLLALQDDVVVDSNSPHVSTASSSTDQSMHAGRPWFRSRAWERCSSCSKIDSNIRACWECARKDCSSCSFWCTYCPKGRLKYTICGQCQKKNIYLRKQKDRKVWLCQRCQVGHPEAEPWW